MTAAIESVMDAIQILKQQNKTEASLLGGGINLGVVNLNLADQELRNQVKQVLETTCNASVDNIQDNNLVYVRNSTTGDIAFRQSGNARADCVMQNSAIAKANLNQQADQSNSTAASAGVLIGIIIAVIIAGIVLKAISKKNPDDGQQGPPPSATAANAQGASGMQASSFRGMGTGRGGSVGGRK